MSRGIQTTHLLVDEVSQLFVQPDHELCPGGDAVTVEPALVVLLPTFVSV